jgi:hypothetical protein
MEAVKDMEKQAGGLLELVTQGMDRLKTVFPRLSAYESLTVIPQSLATQLQTLSTQLDSASALNPITTSLVLRACIRYLYDLHMLLLQRLDKSKLSRRAEADLVFIMAKVGTLAEVLPSALLVPADDLLLLPRTDERWKALETVAEVRAAENPEKLAQCLKTIEEKIMVGTAFVTNGLAYKAKYATELMVGLGTVFYGLSAKKAEAQAKLNFAYPTIQSTLLLWNMVDSKLLAPLYEMSVCNVEFNKIISIPRTVEHVLSGSHYSAYSQ